MSWTLIEHQALTSSAASVTLGSGGTIPQTFKTLKLVISSRSSASGGGGGGSWDAVQIRPNGSTANRSNRFLYGDGSIVGSGSGSDMPFWTSYSGATANTFGNAAIDFPNYTGSTNKPVNSDSVSETNATGAIQAFAALLWTNTSAVTSLEIVPTLGNFVSGSTFTLYGLA